MSGIPLTEVGRRVYQQRAEEDRGSLGERPVSMDPERLAEARRRLALHCSDRLPLRLTAELLADRDYHATRAEDAEREVARLGEIVSDLLDERNMARRDVCRLLAAHTSDYEKPSDAARDLEWADLDWETHGE